MPNKDTLARLLSFKLYRKAAMITVLGETKDASE